MGKKKKVIPTNKNARIVNRTDRTGKLRTETTRRDGDALDIAVSTNPKTGATRLFIDDDGRQNNVPYPTFELNGRQARTLFIALQKHFKQAGVPSKW